jgi:hypothetical protein
MLTVGEQTVVADALASRLAIVGVRTFVTAALAPFDVELLRLLPTDLGTADAQAMFVISYCLDSQWDKTPSLLERLLATLIVAGVATDALMPLHERVHNRIDPNPDPAMALWVGAEMPFFGRASLRPLVKSLLAADARPILQIVGPAIDGEECGKTYTRWLLEYACNLRNDVHSVFVSLPKGYGPSYAVEFLAEALVAPTSRDVASRPQRSQSDYPATLCRWVLNAAILTPGKWIYILDGFSQQDLQAETRALIDTLAFEITGGVYRKRMRLVLIDHSRAIAQVQRAQILRDDVPAATAVAEDEIKACLRAHYADLSRRGRPTIPDEASLTTIAQALLGTAPAGPAKRLDVLNSTLSKLREEDLKVLGVGP